MSDDLKAKAARATHDYHEKNRPQIPERMRPPRPWEEIGPASQGMALEAAEVVVTAIESDIRSDERAKVYSEITEALGPYLGTPLYRVYGAGGGTGTSGTATVTLGDVLRSHQAAKDIP